MFLSLGNNSYVSDGTGQPVNGKNKSYNKIDVVHDIDSGSLKCSIPQVVKLYCMCLRDNEAVIKNDYERQKSNNEDMFPELIELLLIGCSIESILDPKIQIKYIDTKNQLADILTKGNFTRDEWNHLLTLFNISHFSSTSCIAAMDKTSSTRIRRRTFHSQITTHDAFDRKDAFVRVFFSFIKPGEDLVWISRS